jgi:thiol:disulfide interchange protein DsbD
LFGVILWGVAIWLLSRWLSPTLSFALWGALAFGYGIWLLGIWQRPWQRPKAMTLSLALVLMSYGVVAGWGVSQGHQNPLQPWQAPLPAAPFVKIIDVEHLQAQQRRAAALGQPMMLDFSADWCISCQVMERRIFEQPDIQEALAHYHWVQFDVTAFTPAHQALFDQYQLVGPPAVLFFDINGEWQTQRTIYGEVNKRQFIERVGL